MRFLLHRFHKKPHNTAKRRYTLNGNPKDANRPTGTSTGAKRGRNATVWNVLAKLKDDDIRESVARAIPRRSSQWRTCLNRLVQSLRTIDPTATALPYLPVIEQWHRLIPCGDETPTMQDVRDVLVNLWPATEPDDADGFMVKWCRQRVDSSAQHGERVRQALVALTQLFGRKRFFLGVRTLARCAGMSKTCAAKHLNRLLERGAIRVERRSGPHLWDRMADVIHTGPLFALGEAAQFLGKSDDCLPCVRTPNPVFDILNPDREVMGDDLIDVTVFGSEFEDATPPEPLGGWWDEPDVGEPVVQSGRDYAPITMRNVPVDF